ncbi:MAG: hypothetical protein RLZZ292_2901 [Bacteroidota bacterium]|jgi:hypothetical protein
MKEVISTLTQLIDAYKKHHKHSKTNKKEEISHYLLLFYAAECALKAQYLKNYNGKTTEDFLRLPINQKYGHGHDILKWAKELNIPATVVKFKEKPDAARPLIQLHERLRYGVFSLRLEKEQIDALKNIVDHLKDSLNS